MNNSIVIRPVKNEDAEQYIKLNNLVWRDAYKHIFPEEVFIDLDKSTQKRIDSFPKYINNSENQMSYVAENNGEIIGFFSGSLISKYKPFADKKFAELCAIYIHPNYQGLGIGTRFKNIFIDWLKQKGVKKFMLGVLKDNHNSRKVYENWGGKLDDYTQPFVFLGVDYDEVFYTFKI